MNWELVISGLALLISGIVALYSYLQGRKSNTLQEEQTELQRRVVELEEQREEEKREYQQSADVKAEIDFEETGGYRLPRKIIIWNHGPGNAGNIEVLVDGRQPSEIEYLFTKRRKDNIEVLPAGDYYDYPFGSLDNDIEIVELNVKYDDPLDSNQEYKTKLRL